MSSRVERSRAELVFYLTRGAVGAGVPYAVAEMFAAAGARLADLGIDPAAPCAAALHSLDEGTSGAQLTTERTARGFEIRPRGGTLLSVLFAAPLLGDRIGADRAHNALSACYTILRLDCPVLLAAALWCGEPGAAGGSIDCRRSGHTHSVLLEAGSASRTHLERLISTDSPAHGGWRIDFVPVTESAGEPPLSAPDRCPSAHVIQVDAAAWRIVEGFFRRSLVPSSDRSRSAGAGAGLTDTD